MGTLIRFEIKKIVQNRAGVAACAIALILVMALSLGSVLTAGAWDARSGSYVEGLGAWDAIRRTEQSHAGTLGNARVAHGKDHGGRFPRTGRSTRKLRLR